MSIHPDYIADCIKRHFAGAPYDEAEMKPIVAAEWLRLKAQKGNP